MAEEAIDTLKLGQQSSTDFLGVSFSALDSAGHASARAATRCRTCWSVSMRRSARCSSISTRRSAHRTSPRVERGPRRGRCPRAGSQRWPSDEPAMSRIETALKPVFGDHQDIVAAADSDIYLKRAIRTAARQRQTRWRRSRSSCCRCRASRTGSEPTTSTRARRATRGPADQGGRPQLLRRTQRRSDPDPQRELDDGPGGHHARHALPVRPAGAGILTERGSLRARAPTRQRRRTSPSPLARPSG